MKPQFEVADIFRLYSDEYKKTHVMTTNQRKVMSAIIACRTAKLGGILKFVILVVQSETATTLAAIAIVPDARH